MDLDIIVPVTVTRETRAPSQRGFATPIIAACHNKWSGRVRTYSDEDELLEDGWTVNDWVYQLARAMKSQTPSPAQFQIGRRANAFTQVIHLIPRVLTVGHVTAVTFDGVTYSYTVQNDDDTDDVVDGLVAAMSAVVGATVTDGTTHAVVTSTASGVVHSFVAGDGLDLFDATADPGLAADLVAIKASPAFSSYGWLLDSNSRAEIVKLYEFVEANIALGLVQSADWNVKDGGQTDDIASAMKTAAITRTGGIYHSQIGTPMAAAWMAKEICKNPGQSTWAHKTVAGPPGDALSSSQQAAILAKRWSHYTLTGDRNITFEGQMPAGEFLDVIHQIDFSTTRVQEAVFGGLTENDKIPQTDAGIEMVKGWVLTALLACSTDPVVGGGDFPIFDRTTVVVTAPKIEETTQPDRASRILRSVKYRARMTGAYHRVVVSGTVYVYPTRVSAARATTRRLDIDSAALGAAWATRLRAVARERFMSDLAVYNARQVSILVGGIPIDKLMGPDEFVRMEKAEDDVSYEASADGGGTLNVLNNGEHTVTIILKRLSKANAKLSAMREAGRALPQGILILPVVIVDRGSNGDLFAAAQAWIKKLPDGGFGRTAQDVEWAIGAHDPKRFIGGH